MSAFAYSALDQQGKVKKGVIEADNAKQVRQQLREQGLLPTEVNEVSEKNITQTGQTADLKNLFKMHGFGGVNQADVVLLTRQLETLIGSGIPIEEALLGVAQQTERPKLKNVIMAVRARVMEGHTLAASLGAYPSIFNELYRATIAAGEESGYLDAVLTRLADYIESQQIIKQKIQNAAIYPLLMTAVSLVIVIFLMTFVVPKIVTLFEEGGQALPAITVVMINISDFLRYYGLYLLIVFLALIFGFIIMLRYPWFKQGVHRFLLKIPLIGRSIRTINTARYARTLGILSGAGVPVVEAMRASTNVVMNLPIKESLNDAASKVREGGSIQKALAKTHYFPAMSLHLIASGEASGNLEKMLERSANAQDREVENLLNRTVALFEPFMTLFMGVVILIIVLAVLLPIFGLTKIIR